MRETERRGAVSIVTRGSGGSRVPAENEEERERESEGDRGRKRVVFRFNCCSFQLSSPISSQICNMKESKKSVFFEYITYSMVSSVKQLPILDSLTARQWNCVGGPHWEADSAGHA